jgi:hypothetical protein
MTGFRLHRRKFRVPAREPHQVVAILAPLKRDIAAH